MDQDAGLDEVNGDDRGVLVFFQVIFFERVNGNRAFGFFWRAATVPAWSK